jgi:hypothetical protein
LGPGIVKILFLQACGDDGHFRLGWPTRKMAPTWVRQTN